jgi:hypothetical protein
MISRLGVLLRQGDRSPDVDVDGVSLQPLLTNTITYTVNFTSKGAPALHSAARWSNIRAII